LRSSGNIIVDWPPSLDGGGVWLEGLGSRDRCRDELLVSPSLTHTHTHTQRTHTHTHTHTLSLSLAHIHTHIQGSIRDDVYAVGAVLLRLVSGKSPSEYDLGCYTCMHTYSVYV